MEEQILPALMPVSTYYSRTANKAHVPMQPLLTHRRYCSCRRFRCRCRTGD